MSDSPLLPHGENLRRAIQWISDQGKHDLKSVEDASIRFDLTPQEESFLMRHFKVDSSNNTK